ncbi:hypothetical protein ACHAWO_011782 [Cyclotella atomus]|uniref:Uncharacterized protein n=1 Tax=Cyclotella atomus TaxID=382360 RepID=A0ABD3NWV1_9STRA
MDRLRVDLMRSQLSCNLEKQRAKRLEIELKDERKRCEKLKAELERLKQRGVDDVNSRVARVDGGSVQLAAARVKSNTAKNGSTATCTSTSAPFTGNSFDDLPPFAAALAANAEREEIERRRRLGLVFDDEFDDEIDLVSSEAEVVVRQTDALQLEDSDYPDSLNNICTVAQLAQSNVKQTTSKSTSLTQSAAEISNSTYSNLFSTINNSTINQLNSQYTPEYINDDIQTLRLNCILLTHQRATLQSKLKQSESLRKSLSVELKSVMTSERVLRGLQADWTRRLSEARKDMDGKREEWKKEMGVKTREWKSERRLLEEEISTLEKQRDELNGLIKNQKNITFVMGLFCELAKKQLVDSINEGKTYVSNSTVRIGNRIRYGTKSGPHRMLTVGGADGNKIYNNGDIGSTHNAFLLWLNKWTKRFISLMQRIRWQSRQKSDEIATADKLCISTASETILPTSDESMPLVIRKNIRKSKLYQPSTVFERKMRNVDSDVPDFMRD